MMINLIHHCSRIKINHLALISKRNKVKVSSALARNPNKTPIKTKIKKI